MASKQVKQSTFDSIVREGIQDFGLTPQEAVEDACAQLRKAGVTDFANLDISVPSDTTSDAHSAKPHINSIREALQSNDSLPLIDALSNLQSTIHDKRDAASAVADGLIGLLARCLHHAANHKHQQIAVITQLASNLIVTLCATDELNRSAFVTLTDVDGIASMKTLFNSLVDTEQHTTFQLDVETGLPLLQAISSIQRQNERVKALFAAGESLHCLLKWFISTSDAIANKKIASKEAIKLFGMLCFVVRQLLSPDDTTVKVAETFNRARVLAGGNVITQSGLQPIPGGQNLLQILSTFMDQLRSNSHVNSARRQLLTECVATIRACCVSDEICSQVIKLDLHKACLDILQEFNTHESSVVAGIALLRNLAARDECKTPIFENISIVSNAAQLHVRTSSSIAEQYCGLLGNLCLRRPDLARKTTQSGMVDIVLQAMETYSANKGMQRIACLALRNICARDEEARRQLRRKGEAEKLIRKAWKKHTVSCDDVAYAALRELDVLEDNELRRDERYTMPTGFYSTPIVREKD
ncbi:Armadillo repeat-containing protein 6 [Gracilariopsis chorda]|uniref:Armadillo repeat-containing protein 6 n=1 Tax=Gracilariopsis chorda TaxID=448386 RepID=A0A2V3IMB8_9FLOR|nr:Armadillo repeat-containing protein 6 [Gracilariopsis chorda]|eukprot:PXF43221.1 Armadillo repeat-containing protein 6 [Gracilariopsis chorda]